VACILAKWAEKKPDMTTQREAQSRIAHVVWRR
jgi:hypothetical protein